MICGTFQFQRYELDVFNNLKVLFVGLFFKTTVSVD